MKKEQIKKPEIKKPEIKKSEQILKCILTEQELLQAGKDMADAQEGMRQNQSDLDRIKKDISSKIVAEESLVVTNANKIRSGYEFRPVPCQIHFDVPSSGKKTIYRNDTGAIVETREMTADEKQRNLDFDNEGQEEN